MQPSIQNLAAQGCAIAFCGAVVVCAASAQSNSAVGVSEDFSIDTRAVERSLNAEWDDSPIFTIDTMDVPLGESLPPYDISSDFSIDTRAVERILVAVWEDSSIFSIDTTMADRPPIIGESELFSIDTRGGERSLSLVWDDSSLFTIDTFFFIDVDGDGLADRWEYLYFSGIEDVSPEADPDLDGFSNLLEFYFGTDPTQPTPALLSAQVVVYDQLDYFAVAFNVNLDAAMVRGFSIAENDNKIINRNDGYGGQYAEHRSLWLISDSNYDLHTYRELDADTMHVIYRFNEPLDQTDVEALRVRLQLLDPADNL